MVGVIPNEGGSARTGIRLEHDRGLVPNDEIESLH